MRRALLNAIRGAMRGGGKKATARAAAEPGSAVVSQAHRDALLGKPTSPRRSAVDAEFDGAASASNPRALAAIKRFESKAAAARKRGDAQTANEWNDAAQALRKRTGA